MIIKCGRNEFNLNKDDEILYNGSCYQIITRSTGSGWNSYIPVIAKAKAEKLVKDGLLVFKEKRKYSGRDLDIYMIKED